MKSDGEEGSKIPWPQGLLCTGKALDPGACWGRGPRDVLLSLLAWCIPYRAWTLFLRTWGSHSPAGTDKHCQDVQVGASHNETFTKTPSATSLP